MQLRKESLIVGKPDFFRLSFRNCISCVNNCEDLLYTYLNILLLGLLSSWKLNIHSKVDLTRTCTCEDPYFGFNL